MHDVETLARVRGVVTEARRPATILKESWRTVRDIRVRYGALSPSPELPGLSGENTGEQFLPPAVKWLLDHYRFLEDQIRETRDALPVRLYRALPRDADQSRTGLPFVHESASGLVQRMVEQDVAEGGLRRLDCEALTTHFETAQAARTLCLAELWAIRPIIKLSLLEVLWHGLTEHPLDSDTCATVARSVISNLYSLDELPWRQLTE